MKATLKIHPGFRQNEKIRSKMRPTSDSVLDPWGAIRRWWWCWSTGRCQVRYPPGPDRFTSSYVSPIWSWNCLIVDVQVLIGCRRQCHEFQPQSCWLFPHRRSQYWAPGPMFRDAAGLKFGDKGGLGTVARHKSQGGCSGSRLDIRWVEALVLDEQSAIRHLSIIDGHYWFANLAKNQVIMVIIYLSLSKSFQSMSNLHNIFLANNLFFFPTFPKKKRVELVGLVLSLPWTPHVSIGPIRRPRDLPLWPSNWSLKQHRWMS